MDDVSYGTVRDWVAARRRQIWIESGRGQAQAFVLQSHQPGAEGEVDFGVVAIHLAGQMTVCTLFSFRLSPSGRAVHRVFVTAGQEACLEGHVHAFTVIGGVPFGKVRYDNLNLDPWMGGCRSAR
jgi:hypothetical protein